MKVVDIDQEQSCRFPRVGNGRNDSNKLGKNGIAHSPDDDEDEDKEFSKRVALVYPAGEGVEPAGGVVGANRLHGWQHSSRIIRVARATGGKDRHSKVWTSKGLRDRRVRLSVGTAIQFYDLQDRLGFEQPSKAVEWLIEAASDAIAELPSLSGFFAETPRQESDRTDHGFDSPELELDGHPKKQRTAKEKGKEQESRDVPNNPSFTELLTGSTTSAPGNTVVEPNLFDKATAMDYFASSGLIGQQPPSSSSSLPAHIQSAGFSGQIQLPMSIPQIDVSATENPQQGRLQHFSIVPDNLNDYNHNFTISAGLAGCNRGTLQSNISPSLLPYLQRFPHLDGSNVPYFIGAASPVTLENHQHHHHQLTPALFDGSWPLRYADRSHHSDQKAKGKN